MKKLAGQIVQMSQHKFASNVVEKCLEFGGANERQILISEMLGHTDENEPLQVVSLKSYFPLMMGSNEVMLAFFLKIFFINLNFMNFVGNDERSICKLCSSESS